MFILLNSPKSVVVVEVHLWHPGPLTSAKEERIIVFSYFVSLLSVLWDVLIFLVCERQKHTVYM